MKKDGSSDVLAPAPTITEVRGLMKRCQIGVGGRGALDNAHAIMAECYGMLGRQQIEIERLRSELAQLKDDYGRACELVADMHGAATGTPGDGPSRGVVEDVADMRNLLQQAICERTGALDSAGHQSEWQRKIDAAVSAERERIRGGNDLSAMCEAFHRLIESQAQESPFHQPVNADAMIALRVLRGVVAQLGPNVGVATGPAAEQEKA